MKDENGYTYIELLVVLALMGLVVLLWTGDLRGAERQLDFENFAREVTHLLELCRWKAMNERTYAGAWLLKKDGAFQASLYLDGNGNGIRITDIQQGKDVRFYGPVSLQRSSGDVAAGILEAEVPQIPPRTGLLQEPWDPIKFGRSDIISFSPYGDSSSGTLYLACRSQQQMFGIVVYGPTARWTRWKLSNFQWQMVGDQ